MGYTTTTDRTTGYQPTAVDWNILEDNSTFLYGDIGWTTVASFTNSWTSVQTPRYILIGRVVYLNGVITGGTIATTAFTLAAGYRPSASCLLAASSNNAFANILITSAGLVQPHTGSTTNFSVDCSFTVV
jgi:hypothetical protein